METVLITVTCISTAAALAMAAVLFRLLRDEQRRSDARVRALVEMSAAGPWENPSTSEIRRGGDPGSDARAHAVMPDPMIPNADWDLQPDVHVPGVGHLFAEPESPTPWIRRAVVAGTLALLLIVIVSAVSWTRRPASAAPEAAQTITAAPLELLSLRHTPQEDGLTIAGVVQNPHGSAQLAGISATAFLFGPDGTLLASGRAPLDFPLLRAGDESPFVVKVAVRGTVARYRVGFRSPDGRVVAHVDRRTTGALARSD